MIQGIPYGLTRNVPPSVYHARHIGTASKSLLDQMDKSPAHGLEWYHGADESTPALEFGSAAHCAILEPERFEIEYAVRPDFGDGRTKVAKEARAAWELENGGKTALSHTSLEHITGMSASVNAHPVAGKLFHGGDAELTIAWMDPDSGVDCKGRLDYYRSGVVVDLKTTLDASPRGFARSAAEYRYHVQAAMYLQGLQACGEQPKGFIFVAVEKLPPYAVGVYELREEDLQKGYDAVARNLATLSQCLRSGEWPAYSEHIEQLQLPAWAA